MSNENLNKTLSKKLATGKINAREAAVLDTSAIQLATVLYDFDVNGGAVGVIALNTKLPADAVIIDVVSDEQTALTSGGSATLTLKAATTAITAAEAFDTGFAGLDYQSLAGPVKVTVVSELKLTIATAALTAGKVRFAVHYYISK